MVLVELEGGALCKSAIAVLGNMLSGSAIMTRLRHSRTAASFFFTRLSSMCLLRLLFGIDF